MKLTLLLVAALSGVLCMAQPLHSEETMAIGGITQFITVDTRDTTLPVLLFLHGGPGGSVMGYAHKFTDQLQEHFTVVQWDQRETGRTRALNSSPVPLTLQGFQEDAREIVYALLRRFGQRRLYLVAHSWGTVLGFHIVKTHPELVEAYVAIGPMINQRESEQLALSMMKERAAREGNPKAAQELAKVHIPFGNGEQLYYHRKWLQHYAGSSRSLSKNYVLQWADTWLDVFNEASEENLAETLPVVECPVYFFAGKKDYQTNSAIAEEYYRTLRAPRKGFFWFDTGHAIPSASPRRMQELIIGLKEEILLKG